MNVRKMHRRALLALGAAAVSAAGLVVLVPGVASASASKCGWELNGDKNIWTCLDITGSGDTIKTTIGSIDLQSGGRTYDIGIVYFPTGCTQNGCATLLDGSGFHADAPYTYHSISWDPENTEPVGEYCTIVWRANLNTEVAKECLKINA